jgi:hypothetical protein
LGISVAVPVLPVLLTETEISWEYFAGGMQDTGCKMQDKNGTRRESILYLASCIL